MLTLGATDNLAAAQDAGTDVNIHITGADVTLSPEAYTYQILKQGGLTTVAAIVTSPASGHALLIDHIRITNSGASSRIVTFYISKAGTTYTAATQWGTAITLAANESAEWNGGSGWMTFDSTGQPKVALGEPPGKVVHIFQGTTTYTPSAGVRALFVEAVGGGGAGGGVATAATNSGAAGGGGGGAYSAVYTTTMKASFTVAVALGGTAAAAGANNGNVGGDTTFDSASICTAKGGLGGIADTITTIHVGGLGGAGGPVASGVGDVKGAGDTGGTGYALAAAQACSGNGGKGNWGGGGGSGLKTQATGTVGGAYGGGGSGGCALSGGASVAGGAGAVGLLRITELQ